MFKDAEALSADEDRGGWAYSDWRRHAENIAREESDIAASQGRKNWSSIEFTLMDQFEDWWRVEKNKDKQQGGAASATARRLNLLGTRTVPPDFMLRRVGEFTAASADEMDTANAPAVALARLNLRVAATPQSRPVASQHQRYGKNATEGLPVLNAKHIANQQLKGKTLRTAKGVSVDPVSEKNFFASIKRDRKPRHADNADGNKAVQA